MNTMIGRGVTLLALFTLLLSACGGTAPSVPGADSAATTAPVAADQPTAAAASGEKVSLSLWIFEGEEAFLPKLKEGFEAKYPNVSLEITEIPEDQYVTKIDTAIAAGDTPDVGFVYGGQQRWLKASKFLPIDDMIATQNIKLDDYNQNALSLYCTYEGKHYCIGSYTGAVLLFYNKALFDAAGVPYPSATQPMTIDEYAAVAARLSKPNADIKQRVWGASSSTMNWFMDWTTNFSDDGRKAEGFVNDEATVHAFDVMTKLVKDGYAPSSSDMQLMGDVNILAQGQQAMAITDNFAAIPVLEAQNVRYGVAPPPVEQKGDKPFIITWTDAFGVFSQSKHPKEALDFLAYLATDGNKLRLQVDTYPLDAKTAGVEDWTRKNDGRKEAAQVIGLARPVIFVPGFYEITGPLDDAYNLILEGQKTPKEALDEAAASIQSSLDKSWQTWDQIK